MKYDTINKIIVIIELIIVVLSLITFQDDYWFWKISPLFWIFFAFGIGLQIRPKLEE